MAADVDWSQRMHNPAAFAFVGANNYAAPPPVQSVATPGAANAAPTAKPQPRQARPHMMMQGAGGQRPHATRPSMQALSGGGLQTPMAGGPAMMAGGQAPGQPQVYGDGMGMMDGGGMTMSPQVQPKRASMNALAGPPVM